MRLVVSQGKVLPDIYDKLPGRGLHLCADATCFQKAYDRRAFSRHAKQAVTADPKELVEGFVTAGQRQIKAILATVARSGWLQPGRDMVKNSLNANRTALVLLAQDASLGLEKNITSCTQASNIPLRKILSKDELSCFHKGRALAVVGVGHRGLAKRLRTEIDRTQSLQATSNDNTQ